MAAAAAAAAASRKAASQEKSGEASIGERERAASVIPGYGAVKTSIITAYSRAL